MQKNPTVTKIVCTWTVAWSYNRLVIYNEQKQSETDPGEMKLQNTEYNMI